MSVSLTSRRRVLFVSTVGEYGGGERCMLRLMYGLNKKGWDTILACPIISALANQARAICIPVLPVYAPIVFDADAMYDFLPSSYRSGQKSQWRRVLATSLNYAKVLPAALHLAILIQRHHIDLVHANSPRAAMVAGLAGRMAKRPVATHVRDIEHSPFTNSFKRGMLSTLSDSFIAASRATAEIITSSRSTSVVYDGLPREQLRGISRNSSLNQNAPHIGMVAQISPWKGQDVLIRAMPNILKQYPQAHLSLVGSDWGWKPLQAYREYLEQLVNELGLSEHVVFAGQQSDVMRWMQDFDIFVHPPITPDPFPGVVLEASIAGCPIVASYIGGIPEIVQHEFSGLLVQPGIPDAFSNSIIYLLKHPEIAIQLGQNAYKSVQQFTIEHTVTKVEQVYHQLLSEQ